MAERRKCSKRQSLNTKQVSQRENNFLKHCQMPFRLFHCFVQYSLLRFEFSSLLNFETDSSTNGPWGRSHLANEQMSSKNQTNSESEIARKLTLAPRNTKDKRESTKRLLQCSALSNNDSEKVSETVRQSEQVKDNVKRQ